MSQALYSYLKVTDPSCVIDVAVPKHCAALAEFMPEVRCAISLEFKHGQFGFTARRKIGKALQIQGYRHAIVLPNSWKSALIPFFARIKKRTGWQGEARFFLLNDRRKLDKAKYPLMIERFCALAASQGQILPRQLPYPKFVVDSQKRLQVQQKYHINLEKPTVALCPGAEFGPAKKWPTHYYAEVADYLLKEQYQVLLFGSAKDQKTTTEIARHCQNETGLYDLAGKTTLTEAVYLLSLCESVISNDSGLMHIACALDVPVIVIYGSTSDRFTPPLNKKAVSVFVDGLDCRPCFKRTCPLGHFNCMNQLTPKVIIAHFVQRQQVHAASSGNSQVSLESP